MESTLTQREVVFDTAEGAIRKILTIENVNQKELARRMGVGRQNVNQHLTRNCNGMRFDNLKKMCDALGYELVARKISE